jgi:hypothetical protein
MPYVLFTVMLSSSLHAGVISVQCQDPEVNGKLKIYDASGPYPLARGKLIIRGEETQFKGVLAHGMLTGVAKVLGSRSIYAVSVDEHGCMAFGPELPE